MRKYILSVIALSLLCGRALADEGMWLLPALQKMNQKDMKSKGLKISASDIYDANKNSLKDAIVIFGRGCTGEIVSPDGLLFTNHHCGYDAIQSLSSVDHDYLQYGFWAMNRGEELPAPGLTVKFIRHIEDVTDRVLSGVDVTTTAEQRNELVGAAIREVTSEYSSKDEFDGMIINVNTFFGGNQFILFAIEEYKDIRLVGTPPNSIGKFGGDTDNWMWPRHTGDFSVFRVYSDKDGKPAEYSRDNVPYKAPVHLKVSLKGYKEGDFAMIMGFPGSTDRYMTSYEIDEVLNVENPNRILIRGERQRVMSEAMKASDEVRIKYASKYAQSSNYWKNSIGMSRGLKRLDVKGQKQWQEETFRRWVSASPERVVYSEALDMIRTAKENMRESGHVTQFLTETSIRGIEIISASTLEMMLAGNDSIPAEMIERFIAQVPDIYKDYDADLDRNVAKVMLPLLRENLDEEWLPTFYGFIDENFGGDIEAYVDYVYDNTIYTSPDAVIAYLEAGDYSEVSDDPAVMLRKSIMETFYRAAGEKSAWDGLFLEGHRLYIAGLMDMEKNKMLYPDANFTIRLTYGNILPYKPADGVFYDYYTTLTGVMEKEDPADDEFVVPAKLKELYAAKDFGRYGSKGNLPVCFLSNNDITGGNSGSGVLNARGELIGLAFDGNWEAMSGDIAFEPDLQRCINVDIRYVLFVIDKFAGAGYLLDELTIVQ